VFIENVGNLVCPALFDLGEAARVVVVSVTEGEDKPLKYPQMFAVADLVVINKIDLLPYVDVQLQRLAGHCRSVNPHVGVVALSVTTGEGMSAWCDWLLTSTQADV
jgi:hydrogenase nickel incorporation protein HypB